MVFPLHEETNSKEEGRRLAKERYHKIHTLGLSLRARKNLNPVFKAMAGVACPMEPGEIKVNRRKNYVPRRIVQHEPLADITNEPRAVRRRLNPTPVTDNVTQSRVRMLAGRLMRALQCIDDVAMHCADEDPVCAKFCDDAAAVLA
ncbi:g7785 [Coccomyxa elongata]